MTMTEAKKAVVALACDHHAREFVFGDEPPKFFMLDEPSQFACKWCNNVGTFTLTFNNAPPVN